MAFVCAITTAVGLFTAVIATDWLNCVESDLCAVEGDGTEIFGVGLAVATVLFVATGFAIASLSRGSNAWRNAWISLTLAGAGFLGWLFWLLLVFAAGIRATT
jgi:hypothetical protein